MIAPPRSTCQRRKIILWLRRAVNVEVASLSGERRPCRFRSPNCETEQSGHDHPSSRVGDACVRRLDGLVRELRAMLVLALPLVRDAAPSDPGEHDRGRDAGPAGRARPGGSEPRRRAAPFRHDVRCRHRQRHRPPDRAGQGRAPAAPDPPCGAPGSMGHAGRHPATHGGAVVRAPAPCGDGPGGRAPAHDRGLHAGRDVGLALRGGLHRAAQLRGLVRAHAGDPGRGGRRLPAQHAPVLAADLRRSGLAGARPARRRHRGREHLRARVRRAARLLPDHGSLAPLSLARPVLAPGLADLPRDRARRAADRWCRGHGDRAVRGLDPVHGSDRHRPARGAPDRAAARQHRLHGAAWA